MAGETLRVLRLIHNLGGGGVQKRLLSLLPLLQQDFSLYLVSFQGGRLERDFRKMVRVEIIPRRAKFDPICIYRLSRFLKEKNIHILHTHTHKPNTTGRIAGILSGVPVIIANEHNVDSWKGRFQRFLDKTLAKFTDQIIAVSQNVRDFYISIGIPPEKIKVIYNGVDLEKFFFHPMRGKGKRVGFVGRLHPQKGIGDLVKVAERVCREIPEVEFLVCGEGPEENFLKGEVKRRGLEKNFVLMGYQEDMPSFYGRIDLLLLPSHREGFPNVVLESLASGRPVVATDTGGVREILGNGKEGYLVKVGDVEEMSARVIRLLEDRKLREEMGKRGRKKAEEFSLRRMAEETRSLYLDLLEEKKCL